MDQHPRSEPKFRWRDVGEIATGACMMAFPVAATEEVWNLGAELSAGRVLLFAAASLSFLAVLVYVMHDHGAHPPTHGAFVRRVGATYGVTLLVSALLLLGIDRLELLEDPLVALHRVILVAFPASFAATTVDSIADRSRPDGS